MSEDKFIIEELGKITGVTFKWINMPNYTIVGNWFMKDKDDRVIALSVDLAELSLDQEKQIFFGESLRKLASIEKFLLRLPKSSAFPEWFGALKNIKTLIIKQSHLTKLPEVLREFKNLEVLNLEENDLVVLPDWIAELENITDLNLKDNKFSQIPNVATMSYLKRLEIESPTPLSDLTEETLNRISELLRKGVEINSWMVKALFELNVSRAQVNILANIKDESGKNVVRVDSMESSEDQYTIN